MGDINVDLVKSYKAAEELLLSKMDDAEKVQWFQKRAISAEDALKQVEEDSKVNEIVSKYPGVKAELLRDYRGDREVFAKTYQEAVDAAKKTGQDEVEAAIKEALKIKDEEITEMRKVYGKPRQAQAGDVTGAQTQQLQAQQAGGVPGSNPTEPKDESIEGSIRKQAAGLFSRLGLTE